MVVVMSPQAQPAQLAAVVEAVQAAGGQAFPVSGHRQSIVGLVGDAAALDRLDLAAMPGVRALVAVSTPYQLVAREHRGQTSTVRVGSTVIGPDTVTLIAGPCAVESREQTLAAARLAVAAGAVLLRGGAYKPRTSPYAFQGLGQAGLELLAEARELTGLPVVTEVVDAADVGLVAGYADMLQIGTRNMANFGLLQAVGSAGLPVLLKRGLSATYEEWLMAAEYIAQRGNLDIVLCERGIRTFEPGTRNTLDISAVPMVHALSHLPVIVDPSHAAGRRDLVLPLARAGLAAGADGVMVDLHPDPDTARCDGPQALAPAGLDELRELLERLPALLGRRPARRVERSAQQRTQHPQGLFDGLVADVEVGHQA